MTGVSFFITVTYSFRSLRVMGKQLACHYVAYRLSMAPKLVTLNDLEPRNNCYFALSITTT